MFQAQFGRFPKAITRIEDVDEAEMEKRAGEKEYIDAMQYVQSAEFFPPRRQGATGA